MLAAGRRLQALGKHHGTSLVIVESPFLLRQLVHGHLHETALDEPMLGTSGENKQPLQLLPARARLDIDEQALPRTSATKIRMDRQAGKLTGALFGKRVERCTTNDHAVVLEYEETAYLTLQKIAIALDERAICFQWLDEPQDAPDVFQPRRAQVFDGIRREHGA